MLIALDERGITYNYNNITNKLKHSEVKFILINNGCIHSSTLEQLINLCYDQSKSNKVDGSTFEHISVNS